MKPSHMSMPAAAAAVASESPGQQRKLALVARYTDNAVIITDPRGRIEWVNDAFTRITGYSFDEVIGRNPGRLLQGPHTDCNTVAFMSDHLRRGEGFKTEVLNYGKSGRQYLLELDVQPVHDETGQISNFIAIERDVTESGSLHRLALETARQGVWHLEAGSTQVLLSAHFLPLFGYDAAACQGIDSQLLAVTHPDDRARLQAWYQTISRSDAKDSEIEYRIRDAHGAWRWLQTRSRFVSAGHEGGPRRLIGIHSDITERRQAEEEIRRMAYFDPLTGLANRTLLMDRLQQAIGSAQRKHGQLAVLFLDLDNFKTVNDVLGHAGGDALLRTVAARIHAVVRAESMLARLGGDEFVLLMPEVGQAEDAAMVARRILEVLDEPHVMQGTDFHASASIGIAMFPADGSDATTLIKNADTAMYAAKSAGRNALRFFTAAMGDTVQLTLRIENRLRSALRQNQFELAYQPKVDAHNHHIVGMEALLRWHDAELGTIGPDVFIPVAERHGLISAIGDWVLQTACRQNRAWQDAGLPAVPIAVNVSALDFDDPEFPARIRRALDVSGLDPQYLELELTEGALMKNADQACATLKEIKQLGVSIAIDDFGTGYSSLAYLGAFPIDRLKIDRSFIRDLPQTTTSAEITRAIIGIAKRLSMKVVAEGVETAAHADFLENEQCDDLQGYLFSRPVGAQEFETLLRRNLDLPVGPA
ncbi:MAG: EAL domain-containing protein [Leptothrix sp. (in: b-proteobacteria)]